MACEVSRYRYLTFLLVVLMVASAEITRKAPTLAWQVLCRAAKEPRSCAYLATQGLVAALDL